MHILILGGTTEASRIARILAERGDKLLLSLAGRTQNPAPPDVPQRIGGFGGSEGLCDFLRAGAITHVIDATHPYAAQISANAARACAKFQVPLVQLSRPGWRAQNGDLWREVADVAAAVSALGDAPRRVFLSHGRQVAEFAAAQQHFYLVRTIDPPAGLDLLPRHQLILQRGPFELAAERALLRAHAIDVLVTKNSGGTATYPKLMAARELAIPVVMIARPPAADCAQATNVEAVLDWLEAHRAAP